MLSDFVASPTNCLALNPPTFFNNKEGSLCKVCLQITIVAFVPVVKVKACVSSRV